MSGHLNVRCGTADCVECALRERLAKRDAAAARKSLRTMAGDALRIVRNMSVMCAADAEAVRRDLRIAADSIAIARGHFEDDDDAT
jgi:hypothetical protein